MELLLVSSFSAHVSDFPLRIFLGPHFRIEAIDNPDHWCGHYSMAGDSLVMTISELKFGLQSGGGSMALYQGKRKTLRRWEGVVVSTKIGQDPIFLPGSWTAQEIGQGNSENRA